MEVVSVVRVDEVLSARDALSRVECWGVFELLASYCGIFIYYGSLGLDFGVLTLESDILYFKALPISCTFRKI